VCPFMLTTASTSLDSIGLSNAPTDFGDFGQIELSGSFLGPMYHMLTTSMPLGPPHTWSLVSSTVLSTKPASPEYQELAHMEYRNSMV